MGDNDPLVYEVEVIQLKHLLLPSGTKVLSPLLILLSNDTRSFWYYILTTFSKRKKGSSKLYQCTSNKSANLFNE